MVPLLTNPENQKGWPKVVCQDVEKHINELKGTIYRMVGQVSGLSHSVESIQAGTLSSQHPSKAGLCRMIMELALNMQTATEF